MGILADIRLLMDFRKFEKQKVTADYPTPNNPLVQFIGYEKTWGLPEPHDFKGMIEDFNSWSFACAYRNAFSVAKVPLKLFKKPSLLDQLAEEEEITNHPFLDMMRNVNIYFNKFELMVITQLFLEVTGNAYWWLIKDPLGVPRAIWYLPSNWVKVVPDKDTFVGGYVMTVPPKGIKIPFPAEEVVHFKYPGIFSLYYGTPPMYGALYDVNLNKNIKQYGNNFFLNNAQPAGALMTEDALSDEQFKRLMTMWNMRHRGVENAGKVAVLEGGLKYEKIGDSLKEMKFEDTSRSVRDSILAIFGVPASKLGLVEDVNRANAEANDFTYQKETIEPRLTLIEEKINEKIMPMYDDELSCKFDSPVPQDKEFRLKEKAENIRMGYSSIDEERQEDGLEPLNLPETQVPLIPFSVVPAGTEKPTPEQAGSTPQEQLPPKKELSIETKRLHRRRKWEIFATMTKPQENMMARMMKRFFESQRREVMNNLNKYKSQKDIKAGFEANIIFLKPQEDERLKGLSVDHIKDAFESGFSLAYQELGKDLVMTYLEPKILRAIEKRVNFFTDKVNDTTLQLIKDGLTEGLNKGESIEGIARRLTDIFDYSENYRSVRTARTEIIGASNAGQLDAYRENGVEEKEWITARDEKVRDSHQIDGQTIDINEDFTLNSGIRLQYPGDRTGNAPAGELINCRCCVSPVVK